MSYLRTLLFALVVYLNVVLLHSIKMRKFVYQKDMSEYCRRQVIPSVFLGRHVTESNSEILHFSQLDVPYSCFISIRAELASNIILVIQVVDERLNASCQKHNEPLLVYDMGETFGGYWGPIPESFVEGKEPRTTKYYTLKTRSTYSQPEYDDNYDTSEDEQLLVQTQNETSMPVELKGEKDKIDYIAVEVPLMNVSGEMVEASGVQEPSFLQDEIFDIVYDVTPKPGGIYETSVMPLVQFFVRRHEGNDSDEPRYDLDYDFGEYTPDGRLSFPHLTDNNAVNRKNKLSKGYRYNVNRRLKFKNRKSKFFEAKGSTLSFQKKQTFKADPFDAFTRRFLGVSDITTPTAAHSNSMGVTDEATSESWPSIDNLLEMLNNRRSEFYPEQESKSKQNNTSTLLQNISNMQHNSSVYLLPNLSMYNISNNDTGVRDLKELNDNQFLSASPTTHTVTTALNMEIISTTNETIPALARSDSIKPAIIYSDSIHSGTSFLVSPTENSTSTPFNVSTLHRTASARLVDHESWENVVQSAPVIVDILNKTSSVKGDPISYKSPVSESKQPLHSKERRLKTVKKRYRYVSGIKLSPSTGSRAEFYEDLSVIRSLNWHRDNRKKRFIKAIAIDDARPHTLTTRPVAITTSEPMYIFSERQDFAKFVELPDDEMYGHVALHQMQKHVGNLLFNICDSYEAQPRQVFLFNTSRIVIFLNNFTLNRMTLVTTPARILTSPDSHCSIDHLECQVSGARVCIEASNACDGVPNCGAFDIYDEDRMRCGDSVGNSQNVYLAAFTFMIVLFTILYTVHYWLKRCMPKVSDAFFIYTDGSENILYLESIMRSPTDIDDDAKVAYNGNFFNEDLIYPVVKENEDSCLSKIMKYFRNCFRKTSGKTAHESFDLEYLDFFHTSSQPTRMFSFPQLELSKLKRNVPVDIGVQTGDSLEMNFSNEPKQRHAGRPLKMENFTLQGNSKDSELNIIKFLKDTKSASENWNDKSWDSAIPQGTRDVATGVETELHNTVYGKDDSLDRFMYYDSDIQLDMNTPDGPSSLNAERKRLRFDENLTTISAVAGTEYDETQPQQSVTLGNQLMPQELDTIEENEEHSTGREFRFWGSHKGKKAHVKKGKHSTFR